MFDLIWINRMLLGFNKITTPNFIRWITWEEKKQMGSKILPYTDDKIFLDIERDYILSVVYYFNSKIYKPTKMLKEKKEDASVSLR